ncbi:glycosyltransferase [Malaciobacter mytili]|uniref:glycosyltransferase n=1 Tax=Malaciobacter mytili TaxID=603050 RepID=UPI003BAF9FF5
MITEQIQVELSNIIHQDIVKIATSFAEISALNPNLVKELILHINLLDEYKVSYLQNEELEEIFEILITDLQTSAYPIDIAFVTSLNYLLKNENNLEEAIFVQTFFKVPDSLFLETFFIFEIFANNIQKLFEKIITYIFNLKFLELNENIQIEAIYKMWNLSLSFFHDNEASKYAYKMLLKLFHQALHYKKTEVAFWLYYNPLHYFKSGTSIDINKSNEEFKNEVEKPLERYILQELIPKYNLTPNEKKINKNGKIKVAFVMQRLIRLSSINVFYFFVKTLMEMNQDKYEFILYDFSFPESEGSDKKVVENFKKLGIKYIDLQYEIFGNFKQVYSLVEKCIKIRERLIKDEIDILVGLHTRVEYIFLYATRTAPIQIYWYHNSNAQYDIKGIDLRIAHGSLPQNEFKFDKINIPFDISYYNPPVDKNKVIEEKNKFPKDKIIAGSIGRLIKINDINYLKTIAKILEQNPQLIYLACGGGDKREIEEKIEQLNIPKDRFYFTGHINSSIYGHILDIFLVPFLGSGEALEEYRYKGKPYVLLHKEELLSKEEMQILIDSIYSNKQITIKEKSSNLFKPSLYTKEILDSLKEYQYVDKINKNAQMFYAISFAETPEDYINITNELLRNEELRKKISEDLIYSYINKKSTTDFIDYLQEII